MKIINIEPDENQMFRATIEYRKPLAQKKQMTLFGFGKSWYQKDSNGNMSRILPLDNTFVDGINYIQMLYLLESWWMNEVNKILFDKIKENLCSENKNNTP